MIKENKKYIAIPPGATIKEQLEYRGMSQKEFATRMGMTEKHISKLINGNAELTPNAAKRLESVLGIPSKFWLNLETIYRDKLEKIKFEDAMEKDIEILKKLPYNEMVKNNWVSQCKSPEDKVWELRKFFEVAELTNVTNDKIAPKIACRRKNITEKSDYALLAFAQKAKIEARNRNVSSLDISKLKSYVPEIRKLSTKDFSYYLQEIIDRFADYGIAVIFLPHIAGSYLHGATFYDKDKIVIGITARGKYTDKFWFSLCHEIGHIVLGHLKLEDITETEENEADKYAAELLIHSNELMEFIQKRPISKDSILSFAEKICVDPGIIVGRLQNDSYIEHSQYNDLKIQLEYLH